jgi:DNA-binding NtrC family response regulator
MNGEKKFSGSRVLVVDDDAVVLSVIREVLELGGMVTVEARDGEEATELLQRESFAMVVADKNLPGINGLEVLRRAKAVDTRIATLLVTAYASRESAEEAMTIGVDDYVVKPFDVRELGEKVERALGRRETRSGVGPSPIAVSPTLQVLICDPFEESRCTLEEGVRLLEHQIRVVANLGELLEGISTSTIDVIICDLGLIIGDDHDAGFLRSKLLLSPDIQLIVVATGKNLDSAIASLQNGAVFILYRPLGSVELVAGSLRVLFGARTNVPGHVKVLVARKDMPRGAVLDRLELGEILLPQDVALTDTVTSNEMDRIEGKRLTVSRLEGDLILWSCISSEASQEREIRS